MWVYVGVSCSSIFVFNGIFMMLFIRDFSKSCGMEVYRIEKSNVWMEVALRAPKWLNDDSKFVEFLTYY